MMRLVVTASTTSIPKIKKRWLSRTKTLFSFI
jgi:hypothetical protein